MASAGKILVTASSRMRAGSRRARSAARWMRARTAASLSASPSIAIFSLQYPTHRLVGGRISSETHSLLVLDAVVHFIYCFLIFRQKKVRSPVAKLTCLHLKSHTTETRIALF